MRARWNVLIFAAGVVTLARSLRAPCNYAIGHWLVGYDEGPVKRGLVGALVRPLLAWKSEPEVRFVVDTLSIGVLLAVVAGLAAAASPLLRAEGTAGVRWGARALVLAVASSSWLVFAGHTNGYLDHVLEAITLACVALAGTRGRWLVPPLCLAGVATHEIFAVYGLPVVAFATLFAEPRPTRRLLDFAAVVVPSAALWVWLARVSGELRPEAIDALRDGVARFGVVSGVAAENAVYHLRHGALEGLADAEDTWSRISREEVVDVVAGPLALVAAWTLAWLWRPGSRRWLLFVPPVVLAPLALHAVASDTPRFTTMVVFEAFATLLVVAARLPAPALGRAAWPLAAAGVAVVATNARLPVPLLDDDRDGDGALSVRERPTARTFDRCEPAFPNAGFESDNLNRWVATGAAFTDALRPGATNRTGRLREGSVGAWFVSTRGAGPDGDALIGRLESLPFRLVGDTLLLAVGGGRDRELLRVALEIGGDEVLVATGGNRENLRPVAWDVSPWRDGIGRVVITDASTGRWGHLNVDGFCWFRR